jgi:hypothetical protein
MAKTPAGVLGPFSGKVGNVVGSSWKGIRYIRQYVIPANPDTDAQKAERGLFADLVSLASAALGPVLQVFWDPFLRDTSGWAHFIGYNRKLYTTTDDYSTVILSKGTLEGAVITTCTYIGNQVTVAWSESVLGNGALTDAACVFIYDEEHKVGWFDGSNTRDDELAAINIGTGRTYSKINVWLFFADSPTAPVKVCTSS